MGRFKQTRRNVAMGITERGKDPRSIAQQAAAAQKQKMQDENGEQLHQTGPKPQQVSSFFVFLVDLFVLNLCAMLVVCHFIYAHYT